MNYFKGSDEYVLSQALRDNVNVSIALGRPLIVKGEPGTGKTLLAHSIAKGLGKKLIVWNIKSTTKARDGLYVYDTVQRLNDARFGEGDVSDIKQYIKLGKLGEAFKSDEQVVLLIDEIDKAELEFPNDLLNELDEMSFYIPETGETIKAITPADRNHHVQQRKGASRSVPAPVRVSLYRIPRYRPHGGDHQGPLPGYRKKPFTRVPEAVLLDP